jgi:hypothetical protein
MPVTSLICDILGPHYLHDIHVYNPTNQVLTLHQFHASPFGVAGCHHCSGAIGTQQIG